MMERYSDDAVNIQKILSWVENKEDIIKFFIKVPLDQSHLRIPLCLSYFLNLRDSGEENSENNIENDAREIVIILPDTPFILIKNRLRALGNIPNRKEVVVKQLLSERPELSRILNEISEPNFLRKRNSEETIPSNDLNDNKETNVKIKIRKIEGSLQVVSNTKQEIVPDANEISSTLNPFTVFVRHAQMNATSSTSTSNDVSHSVENSQFKCVKNPDYFDSNLQLLPSTSKDLNNVMLQHFKKNLGNINSKFEIEKLGKPQGINISISESSKNKQLPASVEGKVNMQSDVSSEVPKTFDLIDYLKNLSHCSEDIINNECKKMNVSTSTMPDNIVLNELLNRIIDFSELDDTDTSVLDLSLNNETDSNESDTKDEAKIISVKEKPILRPPTFVPKPLDYPAVTPHPIIQPARFTFQTIFDNARRSPEVIPAIPFNFLNRFNIRNDLNEESEVPTQHELSELHPNITARNANEIIVPAKQPELSKIQDDLITISSFDEKLVSRIMEMFPEACPDYLKRISQGKSLHEIDEVITIILSDESYPRRRLRTPTPPKEYDIDEQLEIVKELVPDADPTYLRWQCEKIGNDPKALNEFINEARETKSYPTMKDYLRKQKLSAQSKQYTTEFSVEKFVELFPDPEKTFRDENRKYEIDNYTHLYVSSFFQNRYDKISIRLIRSTLMEQKHKILLCDDIMKKAVTKGNVLKTRRKPTTLQDTPQHIGVLQELAYIDHKEEIEEHIKATKKKEEEDRRLAKINGLLNTCQCCFDDEVMPKDTFACPNQCKFCRSCIQQSCAVALGDGKTEFKCLNDCSKEFALHTLQKVLPPKMFSKLAQKKALAEVQAAGIEELESCPFCDFASIPNPEDKIFRCFNPDCMKESCRLCNEENHVPYKCDEIEKDDDVKARVFVENQMTEALLRKCWKCSMSFFKEEGCNMMTCTCGAKMCYICKQQVNDYSHFNGIGGDKFHLCALYSDTNELNQNNVIKAAEEAKSKVDPTKLKVDPSSDVQQHYENRKRQLPQEPHVQLLQDVRRLQGLQNLGNAARVRFGIIQGVNRPRQIHIQQHNLQQLHPARRLRHPRGAHH